ncbi:MAG TPA: DUF4407 domain-containing protein [Pyrinomonadaceae bacterium]|nr:DUF4407 domain-containing protein [Pyrinomonadaceae bacterium]
MQSPLKRFFWVCSGATISILQKKECETEHSKYVGIGAAVFLTGVLAAVSASYAFSTVFSSGKWAIAFGIFWGAMIFNLDRYLVLSIRNSPPSTTSTWKEKFREWGGVLVVAVPRVALAALLATAITKPLELRLFHDEIAAEMPSLQQDQAKEFQRELETELQGGTGQTTLAARIEKLREENRNLEKEIIEKQQEQAKARQAAVDEAEGRAKLPAGQGPVFELKRQIALEKEKEANDYIKRRTDAQKSNDTEIADLEKQQREAEQTARAKSLSNDGLATQLQAFSRLTRKNPVIWYADLVFMAIIWILEIAPILTKIYSKYGPYDKVLDFEERKIYAQKDRELEELENDIATRREFYHRQKEVLTKIQDRVVLGTLSITDNPTLDSTAYKDLENAKNVLIEQATTGLTRTSENGNKDDRS